MVAATTIDPGYLGSGDISALYQALHQTSEDCFSEGFREFLLFRIEEEALLRGLPELCPAAGSAAPQMVDPARPVAEQMQLLLRSPPADCRIPAPRSAHELWAQHKYSVMARDPARAKEIGRQVSSLGRAKAEPALITDLNELLLLPAPAGRARNAIAHMWGYLSAGRSDQRERMESLLAERPLEALRCIGAWALEDGKTYLVHSTALAELGAALRWRN